MVLVETVSCLELQALRSCDNDNSLSGASSKRFLRACRENPNWVTTGPREAFFVLGQFALEESRRVWPEAGVGGTPHALGAARRLRGFLARSRQSPGVQFLARVLEYGVHALGFAEDAFVHELTDSVIGDHYPDPDRMLRHTERIVHRYLVQEMCGDRPPTGKFDLFAVEGGTAAMCYLLRSLFANGILKRGDTIAVGKPAFTPYSERAKLREYELNVIEIEQSSVVLEGAHTWHYPDGELDKLADRRVKAFFAVHPSNPGSCAVSERTHERMQRLVRRQRSDLIVVTDDVYGPFVPRFRSFVDSLPNNTVLIYSFSKYFGCTGWRLGVIGLHEDNVLDRILAEQGTEEREHLRRRYAAISDTPEKLKFIDRIVADSRDVCLDHTAGLSPPQQAQMALFSLFSLLDTKGAYKQRCQHVLQARLARLEKGLGHQFLQDTLRAGYYVDLDLAAWGEHVAGRAFADYVSHHEEPLEIVLNLARRYDSVLVSGRCFDGPPWSVRISLASLDAADYEALGRDLAVLCQGVLAQWRSQLP